MLLPEVVGEHGAKIGAEVAPCAVDCYSIVLVSLSIVSRLGRVQSYLMLHLMMPSEIFKRSLADLAFAHFADLLPRWIVTLRGREK